MNDSEFIRDLKNHALEISAEIKSICAALIDGKNSGALRSFDLTAFKLRMHAT